MLPTVSQRRSGSRKGVNRKGERVSPYKVPRLISMEGVGPHRRRGCYIRRWRHYRVVRMCRQRWRAYQVGA
jgi:hypothetical protein